MKISNSIKILVAAQMLSDLFKKVEKFDAYKLGLINDKFKIIKKPKTKEEKKALNLYYRLIFKIREKFSSKLLSLLSLFLFMEEEKNEIPEFKQLLEDIKINIENIEEI